jgi:hypothetical protein
MLTFRNYIIAAAAVILITLLIHVAYDIAAAMTVFDDIEFYVAFIGGGLTMLIYNAICNRKEIN